MAVNISPVQLGQPDFVVELLAALDQSGLAPDRLLLEITETAVLTDIDRVIPRLAALRTLGVRVAVDDFGTGYSSLSYLSRLPLDVLKIDKAFVDRVLTDAQGASVAQAVLDMSNSLGLTTVAEGVEQAEQARWLRAAGCTLGQGYLWSRPVAREEMTAVLARYAGGTLSLDGPTVREELGAPLGGDVTDLRTPSLRSAGPDASAAAAQRLAPCRLPVIGSPDGSMMMQTTPRSTSQASSVG